MIELRVNNKNLELSDGFSLSIQYNSGVFNFESILGSYSLPFELTKTVINNSLLNYPSSLSIQNQEKRSFKSELWVNGVLLHCGILEVEETLNDTFKCVFKFDAGSFASEFVDLLISDCELGGEQPWIWRTLYNNSNSDFALPQSYNEKFHIGTPFPETWFENTGAKYINLYIKDEYSDNYGFKIIQDLTGEMHFYSPVVPYPFLYRIVEYLFSSLGYNLKSNFFSSDDDLKKLIIYNTVDAQQSYLRYDGNLELQFIVYILNNYNLKNHVPEISVHDFILNLKNYFCIDFNFKDNELKINPIKDYINSTEYIDITSKVLDYEQKNFLEPKGFSIEFQPDANDEYLKNIEDIKKHYTKPLQTFYFPETLPEPGVVNDIAYLVNLNSQDNILDHSAFFVNKYAFEQITGLISQQWINIANGVFSNYYSGYETEVSFKSNISQYITYSYNIAQQQGNSKFHIEKTGFNLRLAFDAGKYNGIPYAGNFTDNLHLCFWSEKGLFKKFWKPFTDWYFSRPYELDKKVLFSVADLKNLDFTKKYLIGNQLYFIDNIKVVINHNGTIEPALVRVMKG